MSVLRPLALCLAAAGLARAAAGPPASIVAITLPGESDERQPVTVPTEPENTVELDFPWPVEDWAGRGFTPDAEKFAGDFVVEASRGRSRMFVTPVAADAHRVLHVVVAQPGGQTRGIPIEFVPAPSGLAWRKVVFHSGSPAPERRPALSLSRRAPRGRLREPSPESEIGLIDTLRLMLNTTAAGAGDVAAANPALELRVLDPAPRSFGDFTLTPRFAVRDSTTDTLALCVGVANATPRRLLFDPTSWVIRAGDRAYPVRTVDFAGELEPGEALPAFLVLARGPGGEPTLLLPDNRFEVSALLRASVNPRPVLRLPLEGFSPR